MGMHYEEMEGPSNCSGVSRWLMWWDDSKTIPGSGIKASAEGILQTDDGGKRPGTVPTRWSIGTPCKNDYCTS
jgi:hypothetical protein